MRQDSLKHIARAVRAMLDGDRLIVFGSASLLAKFPELGEVDGSPLLRTYDADIIPYPFEEEVGMMLDESFGEERVFHQRFGYYADIVRPRVTEADELELLAQLIEVYESKVVNIPAPSAIDVIQFRMDQQGLKQKDLVPFIGSGALRD